MIIDGLPPCRLTSEKTFLGHLKKNASPFSTREVHAPENDPSTVSTDRRDRPHTTIIGSHSKCGFQPLDENRIALLPRKVRERLSAFSRRDGRSRYLFLVRKAPLHLVALAGRASLAALFIHRTFKGATTAHFFQNTLGIQLGLEALKRAIDGLSLTNGDRTHSSVIGVNRIRIIGTGQQVILKLTPCQAFFLTEKLFSTYVP